MTAWHRHNLDPLHTIAPTASPYDTPARVELVEKVRSLIGAELADALLDAAKREAGLRLDVEAEAYKALQEHPGAHAIVPGKPDESPLWQRVTGADGLPHMPPEGG